MGGKGEGLYRSKLTVLSSDEDGIMLKLIKDCGEICILSCVAGVIFLVVGTFFVVVVYPLDSSASMSYVIVFIVGCFFGVLTVAIAQKWQWPKDPEPRELRK